MINSDAASSQEEAWGPFARAALKGAPPLSPEARATVAAALATAVTRPTTRMSSRAAPNQNGRAVVQEGMTDRPDIPAEIHEFASFLLAAFAGAEPQPDGSYLADGVDSPAEKMWDQVYGRIEVRGESTEEVVQKVAAMVRNKRGAATLFAAKLAHRLARHENKSPADVVREIEAQLIEEQDLQ